MRICTSKSVMFGVFMLHLCANRWLCLYRPGYLYPYFYVYTHTHTDTLPGFLSMYVLKLLNRNKKALSYTVKLFLDVFINRYFKTIPLNVYFDMYSYV